MTSRPSRNARTPSSLSSSRLQRPTGRSAVRDRDVAVEAGAAERLLQRRAAVVLAEEPFRGDGEVELGAPVAVVVLELERDVAAAVVEERVVARRLLVRPRVDQRHAADLQPHAVVAPGPDAIAGFPAASRACGESTPDGRP
jgi:hypothetical protein